MFRNSNVLHDSGNCPYTCALLCFCPEAYSPSTPKWRIGFGDSMVKAQKPPSYLGGFLNAIGCLFFWWLCVGDPRVCRFSLAPVRQPAYSCHPLFGDNEW